MAENENILTRLGKLFQNSIVLRKTDSGQIKVKDASKIDYEVDTYHTIKVNLLVL